MAEIKFKGGHDVPAAAIEGISTYVAEQFAGLEGVEVTVRDWLADGDRFAVHWFVEGVHGPIPGRYALPSTESGADFLGWQPTGARVGVHVASFHRILENGELGWTHEWDRLHGLFQIGVHAVGRPILAGGPLPTPAPA